jgi:hypothetical protein
MDIDVIAVHYSQIVDLYSNVPTEALNEQVTWDAKVKATKAVQKNSQSQRNSF